MPPKVQINAGTISLACLALALAGLIVGTWTRDARWAITGCVLFIPVLVAGLIWIFDQ